MAELLGIQKLNTSLGLVTLCQGLSTFIGSPIAGKSGSEVIKLFFMLNSTGLETRFIILINVISMINTTSEG